MTWRAVLAWVRPFWGWLVAAAAGVGALVLALRGRRRPAPPATTVVASERDATREAVVNAYEERERDRDLAADAALRLAAAEYLRRKYARRPTAAPGSPPRNGDKP